MDLKVEAEIVPMEKIAMDQLYNMCLAIVISAQVSALLTTIMTILPKV